MKKSELIQTLAEDIRLNAYRARIDEELSNLGFDVTMMDYHCSTNRGKSFEAIRLLNLVTGSTIGDDFFDDAEQDANYDMRVVDYDIVLLLDLAGFDGSSYYATYMQSHS